ncbi:MAG: polymer-forming cytoskeletal protein [Pseudomonadota bacterium]
MTDNRLRRIRDRASGAVTLINQGCKVTGLITGTGDYRINGAVEGDCDLEGTVTIHDDGVWAGTVKAQHVIVAGHVDGDILASGHVEISGTARITGTVTGEAIAVAEGAVVEGIMRTTSPAEPQSFTEKRAD